MKKKVIGIVLIAFIAVSSLFAADNIVTVTGSPYSMQSVYTSIDTSFKSNYGFAVKVGYRYSQNNILVGADVSYQNYMYNLNGNKTCLTNLQILAKIGGKLSITEKIDLNGDVGLGVDVGLSRMAVNYTNFMYAAGGSMSYFLNSNIAVTAGADVSIEWAVSKESDFNSRQINIVPMLGVEIDF